MYTRECTYRNPNQAHWDDKSTGYQALTSLTGNVFTPTIGCIKVGKCLPFQTCHIRTLNIAKKLTIWGGGDMFWMFSEPFSTAACPEPN